MELRKQEVRLQPQRHRQDTDTGSDTEVRLFESSPFPEKNDKCKNFPNLLSNNCKVKKLENPKNSADFGSNLQRSCTFANRRFSEGSSIYDSNSLMKSKSFATRPNQMGDFKSSAPFEEKLNMFGAKSRNDKRMSNLENLLRNDMNESQRCRQENEIDEEKYLDKNLVLRRESLRKTNVLHPKTLEFQTKSNGQEDDKFRFSFVVVKDFSPPSSPEIGNRYSPNRNRSYSYQHNQFKSLKLASSESDVEEFFQNLKLKDDEMENLTKNFEEVTKINCVQVPKQEIKVDADSLTVDSDIEEFFDGLDLENGGDVDEKITKEGVQEILNLFEDENAGLKCEKESLSNFEECFEELVQELDENVEKKSNSDEEIVGSREMGKNSVPETEPPVDSEQIIENASPFNYENVDESPPVRPRRKKELIDNVVDKPNSSSPTGFYDNVTFNASLCEPELEPEPEIVPVPVLEPEPQPVPEPEPELVSVPKPVTVPVPVPVPVPVSEPVPVPQSGSEPESPVREVDRNKSDLNKNCHLPKYESARLPYTSINYSNLDRARWNARRHSGIKETDIKRTNASSSYSSLSSRSRVRGSSVLPRSTRSRYEDEKCSIF